MNKQLPCLGLLALLLFCPAELGGSQRRGHQGTGRRHSHRDRAVQRAGGCRRIIRCRAAREQRSRAQRALQDHGSQGHARAAPQRRRHLLRRLAPAQQRLHRRRPGSVRRRRIATTSPLNCTTCSPSSGCWATRSSANQPGLRVASHQVADMVFEKILGIRGAFATRIAYISVLGHVAAQELPAHRGGCGRREPARRHAIERAADVARVVAGRPEPGLRFVRGPPAVRVRAGTEDRRAAPGVGSRRASTRRRRGRRTARNWR